MRFLLVQSAPHVPALGGANKHNRALLEYLAARGHDCAVVALGSPEVLARVPDGAPPPVVSFQLAGVAVDAVIDGSRLREHVVRRIDDFAPDRVLVSSEDPAQALLEAALSASPGRVVYLAHTTLGLPCGPQAFLPSEKRTALLRRATAVLAASRYVADYLGRWAGVEAAVLPIHFYPAPSPALGRFEAGAVTLINPCAVKGISIFLELARRLPETPFAAVPTWGTAAADLAALASLPNVTVLPPSERIHEIFAHTRILLVPSLWAEAFGGVCVEAMLCGIPVLASDVGGLSEAMLGVPDLLPVRPIERYEERFDDRGIPVPEVPPQDVGPWLHALRRLLTDRALYERRSRQARDAASSFVQAIEYRQTAQFLVGMTGAEPSRELVAASAVGKGTDDELRRRLDRISPGKLELLKRRLQKGAGAAAAPASIPRQPRSSREGTGDAFPLSFAQQRLWLLHRLDPDSASYNEYLFARLTGTLRPAALAAALDGLAERHELLRTRYVEAEGEPRQIVDPPGRRPLPAACLRALPDAVREAEMERVARQLARRPIDLEHGPVLHILLLHLREDEHLLVLVVHHIAADHWAITIALRELSALYATALGRGGREDRAARPVDLPPLPIQYADFAVHERQWLSGPVLEGFLDGWRRRLAGAPPVLDLPSDRPRPALQTFRGARAQLALTPSQTAALKVRAREEGATLYMLLLAGLQALLYRLTGQEDFVLGTPVAGRNRVETESLIGYFLNVLPLRGRPRGDLSFHDLLTQARQATLDAFSRQELPFEKLVEDLAPERSLSFSPLFQTLLNFQNVPVPTRKLADLDLEPLPIEIGIAKFDLDLYLEELDQALVGSAFYSTDLFDAPTVERMMRSLIGVLAHAAARPADPLAAFPLLAAAEAQQVLVEWNDGGEEPGAGDLPALVAAQAARTPEAVAVAGPRGVAGNPGELTYRELVARAGRLARHLRRLGVGPETLVGLAVERSPDLVVTLLGILAAGGAYLPLEDSYPRERLAHMLADSRPEVLLATDSRTAGRFDDLPGRPPCVLCLDREWEAIDREPGVGLPAGGAAPDNLAYVLFTSGSTGRPKGVQIPRRALVNFLLSMGRAPGCAAGERLLAVTSLAFDIAGLEIFLPLLSGGAVDLVSREEAGDPQALTSRMARAAMAAPRSTWMMQSTPATWRMLLTSGWAGDPRLRALCGGEALPPDLAAALASRVGELWNLYGPTETTVWSSRQRLAAGERVTIGRPIAASSLYVLDAAGAPAPVGVPGELLIGGLGLARGYLGRPDLTAESFVPDPFVPVPYAAPTGGRLYRTGDLARTLPDGRIEHLGRRDHQVKVRGFRIETAEVELALARHPGVAQAVVAARHDPAGTAYLAAWLVPSAPAAPTARELHAFLAATLPEFMIPSVFVPLAELPLTANRKVDRKALPELPRAGGTVVFSPPGNALEEAIAALWREVLGAPRVGRHDNFFELGGHSLLANQLVSRLRRSLEVDLPVRALFEAPTVAALAMRVDAARATGRRPLPPIQRADRSQPLPLSSGQRRLWFLDQLEPGSPAYNVPILAWLDGALDERALWRSLGELVARHEVLRTRFESVAGEPRLSIAETAAWPPCRVELGALPEGRREEELGRLGSEEAARSFDLASGPLYHGMLVGIAAERQALLLVLHHAVCDGWSLGVLLDELTALYAASIAGEAWALPELAVQYADFAAWQQSPAARERRAGDLVFWRQQLAGAPPLLALPTDRPRQAVQSLRGRQVPVRLSPARRAELQAESRRQGVTPFMLLLATLQVLLSRWSGQSDIVVGTPVANRTRPEIEGLIGFFVNTLALRGDLRQEEPFAGFLDRIRAAALAAYDHQDLPFEELVAELTPERSLGHSPLFQVVLALHAAPLVGREVSGLRLSPVPLANGSAKLDLFLALGAEEDGWGGTLEYATALFDRSTIERFVGHFEILVTAVSEAGEPGALRIGDLPLLNAGEGRQLTAEGNDHAPAKAAGEREEETPGDRAPLRETEEILAGLWRELLGIPRVGRGDNFFELGGHSLLATQLVAHIWSHFSVELPVRRVFEAPILTELAALVESLRAPLPGVSDIVELPQPLDQVEREMAPPLSFGQERLLFLDHFQPAGAVHNLTVALRLRGELSIPALVSSFHEVVRRHEILRTTFGTVGSEPVQIIGEFMDVELPLLDLSGLAAAAASAPSDAARRLAEITARQPFDLARGPLLRVRLLRLAASDHVLVAVMHHIVSDRWSLRVLTGEVWAFYGASLRRQAEPLPPLPLQYRDFAVWQRRWLQGEVLARELAYWRSRLAGAPDFVRVPADLPRPTAQSFRGAAKRFTIAAELAEGLHELARREGSTLFVIFLTALYILLHHHSGEEDLVVSAPVSARNWGRSEGLIGFLVNTLLLRGDLSGNPSLRVLLRRIHTGMLDDLAHQHLPLDRIIEELAPGRSQAHNPFLQVGINFAGDRLGEELDVPGLAIESFSVAPAVAQFELNFVLSQRGQALSGSLQYQTRLFSPERADRLIAEYQSILAALVSDLDADLTQLRGELVGPALVEPAAPQALEGFVLSPQQERLWSMEQEAPEQPLWALCTIEIEGPLASGDFDQALRALVARYEILRSTFRALPGMTVALQTVSDGAPFRLRFRESEALDRRAQDAELDRLCAELGGEPSNLAAGPAFQAVLLAFSGVRPASRKALVLRLPALCADGATLRLLFGELAGALSAGEKPGEPLQYADVAQWEYDLVRSSSSALAAGPPPVLTAALPFAAPPRGAVGRGATSLAIAPALAEALAALAGREAAGVEAVLLAAWQSLTRRLANPADVAIGIVYSARREEALREVLGPLELYLPFPWVPGDDLPFDRRVAATWVALVAIRELPLDRALVPGLLARPGGMPPRFDLGFDFAELPAASLGGAATLTLTRLRVDGERTRLRLSCLRQGDRLAVELRFDSGTVGHEDSRRLGEWYLALLAHALEAPATPTSELSLLRPEEQRQVVAAWSVPRVDWGGSATLPELFAAQVRATPERIALLSAGSRWTYAELDRAVARLAVRLAELGAGPEARIALGLERSSEMVIAILAILRRGAAYVPLDPELPADRLGYMLGDSQATLLVTAEHLLAGFAEVTVPVHCLGRLDATGSELPASPAGSGSGWVSPESLAYVLYTSGSTGRPKGVMMSHRGIANRVLWMRREFSWTADDTVLLKTPYSFDASIWEIFVPLVSGARLALSEPGAHRDPAALLAALAEHRVTTLQLVPSQLAMLLESPDLASASGNLTRLFCGGEALPGELVRRFSALSPAAVCNLYGPTEVAIDATYHPCSREELKAPPRTMPIGRPLDNVQAYVLDPGMRLLPEGLAGELFVGGEGLARGYLGRPDLTAERFVPNPWSGRPGDRLYRTGDLVRRGSAGTLEFLGRADGQVKIRGVRIELEEIEAALASHPEVARAAVVARDIGGDGGSGGGERHLVAYFQPAAGTSPAPRDLRELLRRRLPEPMVPGVFVSLAVLPFTPSGKVDRNALPDPGHRAHQPAEFIAPRTAVEQALAAIWQELLGVERVGARDDFFDLGGHSLQSMRLVSHLRGTLGVELGVRSVFEHSTLAGLAKAVTEEMVRQLGADLVAELLATPPVEAERQ